MAAVEDGKDYLTKLLASFNNNFEIIKCNFKSSKEYSVVLRTRLPEGKSPQHSCDLWKESFSKTTNTCWTVRETYPNAIDFLYRKKYVCQHNKHNKSKLLSKAKSKNYTKYRNKNCEASIDIKVQKVTKSTLKKHKHLREGRTATIKVIQNIIN